MREGSPEEWVMLGVYSMDGIKVLWLIIGLRDGWGLLDLIDGGVCGVEPGESKDNVLLATAHDIEEMFLGDPFNICIESASIANCTSFVCSLIHIANSDGRGEFFSGKLVFSDKLPVYAEDICTRVY